MKRPTGEVSKKFHHYRLLKNGLYRFNIHSMSEEEPEEFIIFENSEAESIEPYYILCPCKIFLSHIVLKLS